ncbi:tumor protein p53-inducible protein 11-like isoform X3 [Babylonia areolata]|uniref:tumor protein p53-inducible protein 11-like isoform X3 n=1 Tax=Babylonia areolata TaxID=304850 RepID=UPI003FD16165
MAAKANNSRQDVTSWDGKLSSSDLHSRLKTRKVLGVGETDDGDVHRSKLSQILGHSDQLYVRLPWGLRVWQFILALSFTVVSLWALILPSHIFDVTFESDEGKYVTLPVRLYGTALLALSLFHWHTVSSSDRDIIRVALLSSAIYFFLQTLVSAMGAVPMRELLPLSRLLCHVLRLGATGVSGAFYWIVCREARHYTFR